MKPRFIPMQLLLSLCIALAAPLQATPNRSIVVEERFAGSNDMAYAVLRTETDNLSSYYVSQRKLFLDERSKDGKTLLKSTFIVEIKSSIPPSDADPTQPDPQVRPAAHEEIIAKDDSVSLAAFLAKYSRQAAEFRDPARLARIGTEQDLSFDRLIILAGSMRINEEIFGGRLPDEVWRLVEVAEDANVFYFTLGKGDSENREQRILCIDPDVTAQVRALLNREKIYLVAGAFDTQEAAILQAGEWLKACRPGFSLHPQVWKRAKAPCYVVVEAKSMDLIAEDRVSELEESFGVNFEPVSGESLTEWIKLP